MSQETKKCKTCKEVKSLDEFEVYQPRTGALRKTCTKCLDVIGKPRPIRQSWDAPMRKCLLCERVLSKDLFTDYCGNQCTECIRERDKREYSSDHPESRARYLARARASYRRNRMKRKRTAALMRERRRKDEKLKALDREYMSEYQRTRRRIDPLFRLKSALRCSVYGMVVRRSGGESKRTRDLIGCDYNHLKAYLESLWFPGMSWTNYGAYRIDQPPTWHIDHIRPCDSFDLTDPAQQKACFHYTNLQPLWAADNISKGTRLDWSSGL